MLNGESCLILLPRGQKKIMIVEMQKPKEVFNNAYADEKKGKINCINIRMIKEGNFFSN